MNRDAIEAATGELDESRRVAERRFAEVRASLDRELGGWPSSRAWALPLVAFGVGLALAVLLKRR